MKENRGDKSGDIKALPTASGFRAAEGAFLVPPPQIEGYEIIGEVGEAGQGRVWRAMQLSTHREVALKVPRVDLLTSRRALARFEREVELTARLKHPNIARIYDSGIYQGLYYYAMELIEGMSLDRYIERHDLTQRQVVELMRTICGAVKHAHQNGVIHRDIKPSNIIVTEDGQPHVVDFGLAMDIPKGDAFKTVSVEGEVIGTPAYMSPEQAAGHHEQLDTRTDVYSLGVVFYKVLTRNFPYDVTSSMLDILRNIQRHEPIRPSKVVRNLDSDIEAIVLKALAKEPAHRYQSVAELHQDTERWLNGLPILAKSDSSVYLLRKLIVRHRYTSTVLGLLLLIVLAFSYVSFDLYITARKAKTESEATSVQLAKEAANNLAFARQVTLTFFLQAWHEGETKRAVGIAGFLLAERASKEKKAIRFLLDERPLDEKEAEFRQALEDRYPAFVEFVIGEHHLKNDNRKAAIEAYHRARQILTSDESRANRWLTTHIKARLDELSPRSPD